MNDPLSPVANVYDAMGERPKEVAMSEFPATIDEVRRLLAYDPDTGALAWRATNKSAGNVNAGYIRVWLNGHWYYGHRLGWAIHYGAWPRGILDHLNCVPLDNRIANLRDVDRVTNRENQRNAPPNNKLGVLGVKFQRGSYRSTIQKNGKRYFLGCFKTAEEAHRAYVVAKRRLHPGCTL